MSDSDRVSPARGFSPSAGSRCRPGNVPGAGLTGAARGHSLPSVPALPPLRLCPHRIVTTNASPDQTPEAQAWSGRRWQWRDWFVFSGPLKRRGLQHPGSLAPPEGARGGSWEVDAFSRPLVAAGRAPTPPPTCSRVLAPRPALGSGVSEAQAGGSLRLQKSYMDEGSGCTPSHV